VEVKTERSFCYGDGVISAKPSARPSEARERLLDTAAAIFYASGIHSVGVERIVAEARVTRATFYRHFPSKEDLVAAYLERAHQRSCEIYERAVASGKPAADVLREIGREIVEEIRAPGFRGCAFLNAAAEYPDAGHPVHQTVLAHREWVLTTITDLFAQARDIPREGTGRHFVMLRDGVMAAGYLGDPVVAGETFLRGIEGMLQVHAVDGMLQLRADEVQG
jgi:AcrR family transcriptional regulator